MTLGEKLQYLRKQNGLSQEQFASKLTVSRQAVSKWELDSSLPDTENIVQISSIFGVTTDYLLKEDAQQTTHEPMPTPLPATKAQNARTAKIMMLVGGIGVLVFWILSSVYPVVTSFSEGSAHGEAARTIVKTGLPAFLELHQMQLLFACCCLAFAVGIAMYFLPIIKAKRKRGKKTT